MPREPTCTGGRRRSIVSGLLFTMKIATRACEPSARAAPRAPVFPVIYRSGGALMLRDAVPAVSIVNRVDVVLGIDHGLDHRRSLRCQRRLDRVLERIGA